MVLHRPVELARVTGQVVFGQKHSSDRPSANDIEAAKRIKKPVHVTSKTGLWEAEPSGKVNHIFSSPTWFSDKKPN
jgi:hypothetical protein